MAFIPTPNAVKCAVVGTIDSQECTTTLWFLGAGPAGVSDLSTLALAVIDWMTNEVLPLLSNGYALDAVEAYAQDSNTAPAITNVTGLPAVGAVNSATQAPQVAGCITFSTINRGRTSRGRNYIPGIPTNALATPGTMGNTFLAAMQAAYGALNSYTSVGGYTHVVVSHYHDHSARTAGLPQSVLSYSMDAPLDTQRRRSYGRGV